MAIKKIQFDGKTLIDLTSDTVGTSTDNVVSGKTFHGSDGVVRTGTLGNAAYAPGIFTNTTGTTGTPLVTTAGVAPITYIDKLTVYEPMNIVDVDGGTLDTLNVLGGSSTNAINNINVNSTIGTIYNNKGSTITTLNNDGGTITTLNLNDAVGTGTGRIVTINSTNGSEIGTIGNYSLSTINKIVNSTGSYGGITTLENSNYSTIGLIDNKNESTITMINNSGASDGYGWDYSRIGTINNSGVISEITCSIHSPYDIGKIEYLTTNGEISNFNLDGGEIPNLYSGNHARITNFYNGDTIQGGGADAEIENFINYNGAVISEFSNQGTISKISSFFGGIVTNFNIGDGATISNVNVGFEHEVIGQMSGSIQNVNVSAGSTINKIKLAEDSATYTGGKINAIEFAHGAIGTMNLKGASIDDIYSTPKSTTYASGLPIIKIASGLATGAAESFAGYIYLGSTGKSTRSEIAQIRLNPSTNTMASQASSAANNIMSITFGESGKPYGTYVQGITNYGVVNNFTNTSAANITTLTNSNSSIISNINNNQATIANITNNGAINTITNNNGNGSYTIGTINNKDTIFTIDNTGTSTTSPATISTINNSTYGKITNINNQQNAIITTINNTGTIQDLRGSGQLYICGSNNSSVNTITLGYNPVMSQQATGTSVSVINNYSSINYFGFSGIEKPLIKNRWAVPFSVGQFTSMISTYAIYPVVTTTGLSSSGVYYTYFTHGGSPSDYYSGWVQVPLALATGTKITPMSTNTRTTYIIFQNRSSGNRTLALYGKNGSTSTPFFSTTVYSYRSLIIAIIHNTSLGDGTYQIMELQCDASMYN